MKGCTTAGVFFREPFLFNRKLRSLLNKTLRGMRTRAKREFAVKAAALGAEAPLYRGRKGEGEWFG